jgi:predicted nucleic acid-binding protein
VDGYLFDNNIVSVAGRRNDPRYPVIDRLIKELGTSPVFLPAMALGEIEFGMATVSPRPIPDLARDELLAFFRQFPILPFGEHTIEPYAKLRARIWRDWATPNINKQGRQRGYVEKKPENLGEIGRCYGNDLRIDERDLIIVSASIENELVFVTNDGNAEMVPIEQAASALLTEGEINWFCMEHWDLTTGKKRRIPQGQPPI